MAKTELLTVRMDSELYQAFMAAARGLDRPASQITRDLVRAFVDRQSRTSGFEEALAQHEATLAQTYPVASPDEYQAFLAEKVGRAREQMAAGKGVTHEQVVAEGAARRAALLKRLGQK